MSRLTLVRHAQASFHADHYDQLSKLGENQAQILGESWLRAQRVVDEVYVGPRARQQQTAEFVAASFRRAGRTLPQPIILSELDEYDLEGLVLRLAPELARQNAEFAKSWQSVRSGSTERELERNFQIVFETLTLHWLSLNTTIPGLESWLSFRDRVRRGVQQIVNQPGKGRHVVAFTSGGFIGTAVQFALNAPDRMALELNWRIRNGSVTDLVFSGERITLDVFNSVAHFSETELLTYR